MANDTDCGAKTVAWRVDSDCADPTANLTTLKTWEGPEIFMRARRLCVFCGSRAGFDPRFRLAAVELGRLMVAQGWGLVYGGGAIGLMGALADSVLEAGGEVIGVIPTFLARREVIHANLTETHVVESMHIRKALMAEKANAFVGLPGGFGTLEELFEVITWAQLGLHEKPIGLLNVCGFFRPLIATVDHAVAEGFLSSEHRELFSVADSPSELLERLNRAITSTEKSSTLLTDNL